MAIGLCTTFPRAVRVLMHGRCHVWPWLSEFSSVGLNYFTHSRSTTFTDVSLNQPEDTFNPFFKAVLYSVSGVRKPVNLTGFMEKVKELSHE